MAEALHTKGLSGCSHMELIQSDFDKTVHTDEIAPPWPVMFSPFEMHIRVQAWVVFPTRVMRHK